jgi:paraquat-inducible protein B
MRANPTAIGAFTLGAVAIALAALIALGTGHLFASHLRAVAFFTDDLQGLSVGSPVNFHGVQIGKVSGIRIRLDLASMRPIIPIDLDFTNDFDVADLKGREDRRTVGLAREQRLRVAIANGLHARLATQSLITGQRIVELDFDPDAPRTLAETDPAVIEIPTMPSHLDQIENALARLPIDKIGERAVRVLDDADRLLDSPELSALIRSLHASSDSIGRAVDTTAAGLGPLIAIADATMTTARDTLHTAQGTLEQARTTFATGDRVMSTDLRQTLKTAVGALQTAQRALTDADGLLAANSPQRYDLDESLQNLSAMTHALRLFSEGIERRPNALVMGK